MSEQAKNNAQITVYKTPTGEIKLSPQIVRRMLVNGGGDVTEEEALSFIALCKYRQLNPFLREAYLIKYRSNGGRDSAATLVVSKDVFLKRAAANEKYNGYENGVIVQRGDELVNRPGSLVLTGETLVGGWAKVHRKDQQFPVEKQVSMSEYERKKNDGTPMSSWASMPATMIAKVALMQALRDAFPEDLSGMYETGEMPGVDDAALPKQEIRQAEVVDISHDTNPQVNPKRTDNLSKITQWIADRRITDGELKGVLNTRFGVKHIEDLDDIKLDELVQMYGQELEGVPVGAGDGFDFGDGSEPIGH